MRLTLVPEPVPDAVLDELAAAAELSAVLDAAGRRLAFWPAEDGRLHATLTGPDGRTQDVPLTQAIDPSWVAQFAGGSYGA